MSWKNGVLNAKRKRVVAVDLPEDIWEEEWPKTVYLKVMKGSERDAWEESTMVRRGGEVLTRMDNFRANLLARVIVDEDGDRVFNDIDAGPLGESSSLILDCLFAEACKINRIGRKDVEELSKN